MPIKVVVYRLWEQPLRGAIPRATILLKEEENMRKVIAILVAMIFITGCVDNQGRNQNNGTLEEPEQVQTTTENAGSTESTDNMTQAVVATEATTLEETTGETEITQEGVLESTEDGENEPTQDPTPDATEGKIDPTQENDTTNGQESPESGVNMGGAGQED